LPVIGKDEKEPKPLAENKEAKAEQDKDNKKATKMPIKEVITGIFGDMAVESLGN